MALHLNWDGNQSNGIIFNDEYPNGAMFKGDGNRPDLTFSYHSFAYTEVFDHQNYVLTTDGIKRPMSVQETEEIKSVALNWIQQLGQEGNPNAVQLLEIKRNEVKNGVNEALEPIISKYSHAEIISWTKQEELARAYIADNTSSASFLETLALANGISTLDMALKIVDKADIYTQVAASVIAKRQSLSAQIDAIENDTTMNEDEKISALKAISW